jgi:hypothetical protein
MSAVGDLAERSDGYHRVSLTDALIAAEHGGIALLHRDTHSEAVFRAPAVNLRYPNLPSFRRRAV